MASHRYRETLKHRGIQPFLWTQLLGALNDNLVSKSLENLRRRARPRRVVTSVPDDANSERLVALYTDATVDLRGVRQLALTLAVSQVSRGAL